MDTKQDARNELFVDACADGFEEVVESMLNSGDVNLNYLNKDGHSALWSAVYCKHTTIAKLLLRQRGIHLNTLNQAIEEAHKQGDSELAQEILSYPYAVSNSPREQTAELIRCCDALHGFDFDVLTAAIKLGNMELAEKIVDVAEIYIDMNADYTPLVSAIERGYIPLIEKLLNNPGIDINAHGSQEVHPLLAAVKSPEIVQLLLQKPELNRRSKDSKGNTALILAVKENAFETVKLLVSDGHIDINVVNNDAACFLTEESRENLINPYGDTETAATDRTFGVQPLLGRRLAKGEYSKVGVTALQTAVSLGYSNIALYLIETANARTDILLPGGYPLLFLAIQKKMDDVVNSLIKHMSFTDLNTAVPDPRTPNRKVTALHIAFRTRALNIFKMLLKLPINVNFGEYSEILEDGVTGTILGEVFHVHRHSENVYEYMEALVKRSDLNVHIYAYFPIDSRTIFQIMQDEDSELLEYIPNRSR